LFVSLFVSVLLKTLNQLTGNQEYITFKKWWWCKWWPWKNCS